MAGGQASAQKISIAERRYQALSLRKQGGSYRQIAAQLRQVEGISPNYDEKQAHRDVIAELNRVKEQNAEQAQEVLQLELIRLDEVVSFLWDKVKKGDLFCIDRLFKAMEMRARYLGLFPSTASPLVGAGGQLNINQNVVVYLPDNGRGDIQPTILENQPAPVAVLSGSKNAGNDRDTPTTGAANGVSQ